MHATKAVMFGHKETYRSYIMMNDNNDGYLE